jgi:hypothetical protein
MMSATMRREPRKSAARPPTRDLLAEVARTKLLELGSFAHLHIRRQAEHIVIEQPGPPETPDDTHPVLRLTPIGGFRFALSLRRHTNRWEPIPVSGPLAEVLASAVAMFGAWLAPEPLLSGTSKMDY